MALDPRRVRLTDPNPADPNPTIGNETGGDQDSVNAEGMTLIKMMAPVTESEFGKRCLSFEDQHFMSGMIMRTLFPVYIIRPKELFRLRDIKDRMVERGIL